MGACERRQNDEQPSVCSHHSTTKAEEQTSPWCLSPKPHRSKLQKLWRWGQMLISALTQSLSSFLRPPMSTPSSVKHDASFHFLKTRLTQDAQCMARSKFLQLLSWSVPKIWNKYKRSTTTWTLQFIRPIFIAKKEKVILTRVTVNSYNVCILFYWTLPDEWLWKHRSVYFRHSLWCFIWLKVRAEEK